MKKFFTVILSLSLIIAPVSVAHAGMSGAVAKQVLGIANGVIGASVITKCKMSSTQISILIYMAGSLVYVASEIMGGKKKARDIDGQAQSLDQLKTDMKEGGDYQKAAIDAQMNDIKSSLEFVQKRRRWMAATKAIYAAATAMAIIETWWRMPYPVGINKDDDAGCIRDESHRPITEAIGMAYSSLMAAGGNVKGMAVGMAAQYAIKEFLPALNVGADIASKSISVLNTSIGRIAFFGAATALVVMVDKELEDEEKRYKDQLTTLERVKTQFDATSNALAEGSSTTDTEGVGAGNGETDPTKKNYDIKRLSRPQEIARHCFSTAGGSMNFSESGCKSPYQFSRPKFDASLKIPTLVAGTNSAMDLGQAIADGDLAKADVAAGSLAAMAGRLESVRDGLMKKTNDKLIAEGKKPIDLDGEVKRQVAALSSGLNKAGHGGNFDMASFDVKAGEASLTDEGSAPAGEEAVMKTVPSASSGIAAEGLNSFSEDSLLESENGEMDTEATGKVATLSESLSEFESSEGDISQDSDVSLFKQVSNRYFLNYNKIFSKRKEIVPIPSGKTQNAK